MKVNYRFILSIMDVCIYFSWEFTFQLYLNFVITNEYTQMRYIILFRQLQFRTTAVKLK